MNDDLKKQKIRTFHTLLHRLGMMGYKHDIIAAYGVESTTELEIWELDELIDKLRSQEQYQRQELDAQLRHLRSTVLAILQRMGIYQDNGSWHRVNAYLKDPRICGKMLYQCSPDELRALVKKLRGVERKNNRKKADIDRMVLNN